MAFKEKVQENNTVNEAWNNLFQRLENDGLLPENEIDKHKLRHIPIRRMLYAAAIFAACIISGWYFTRETYFSAKDTLVLYNEANAPTLATMLEDGSVVYLSEQASLKYPDSFADDKREVSLQGNAFFEIKKQPERPFFIDTDLAEIEVTGTSFSVKCKDNSSFLLSVRDGEVRVMQKSSKQIISVKAGESVLLDSKQIQLINNTTRFDEYFKQIHFKDEYLGNVADIINMHSESIRLKIDPEVAKRSITFTLSMESDLSEIVDIMSRALQLQHTQHENTIYISN